MEPPPSDGRPSPSPSPSPSPAVPIKRLSEQSFGSQDAAYLSTSGVGDPLGSRLELPWRRRRIWWNRWRRIRWGPRIWRRWRRLRRRRWRIPWRRFRRPRRRWLWRRRSRRRWISWRRWRIRRRRIPWGRRRIRRRKVWFFQLVLEPSFQFQLWRWRRWILRIRRQELSIFQRGENALTTLDFNVTIFCQHTLKL